ncbi:hypothetical protein L6452_20237 [Arctium lappa]|uniref:Uncharacterized protein n=1 Tax=Arctium lappa TaxID=4217 RepID=A0ACB9BBL0_ARCLA|nr:hypothetical protein L6452_20237 [Arctium lappa]
MTVMGREWANGIGGKISARVWEMGLGCKFYTPDVYAGIYTKDDDTKDEEKGLVCILPEMVKPNLVSGTTVSLVLKVQKVQYIWYHLLPSTIPEFLMWSRSVASTDGLASAVRVAVVKAVQK